MKKTTFAFLLLCGMALAPQAQAYQPTVVHAVVAQPAPDSPAPETADSPAANEDQEQPAANGPLDVAKDHLDAQGEKMASEEEPAELPDLVAEATKVYSDWKTGGWMAGLLALVSLFMSLLRFKPVNQFFRDKQIMWLKPILAAAFGGALAGMSAGFSGAGVGPSIIAGLLAGLGAVGLYEVTKRRKAENREA